ncbi:Spy/CpxP family protein refolding chaperone [Candidatus Omnitrophota bacterium]
MKIKLLLAMLLIAALTFGNVAVEVCSADHGAKGKSCYSLEGKFCKKAKIMLSNKDELGLTDAQVKKVKELKVKTKKDLIKKKAEIDIVALDIKAQMWEDPIDTATINKLIDKKYNLKKEKAKSLVDAYATLKGLLTEEQKAKMKEVYKKCKKK